MTKRMVGFTEEHIRYEDLMYSALVELAEFCGAEDIPTSIILTALGCYQYQILQRLNQGQQDEPGV